MNKMTNADFRAAATGLFLSEDDNAELEKFENSVTSFLSSMSTEGLMLNEDDAGNVVVVLSGTPLWCSSFDEIIELGADMMADRVKGIVLDYLGEQERLDSIKEGVYNEE